MTEEKWLTSLNPQELLRFAGDQVVRRLSAEGAPTDLPRRYRAATARIHRLFMCACIRAVWPLATDTRCRAAVLAAEAFADDRISKDAVRQAERRALEVAQALEAALPPDDGTEAPQGARSDTATRCAVAWACYHAASSDSCLETLANHVYQGIRDVRADQRPIQAALVRHLVGNPFRPYRAPAHWPLAVVELAVNLYDRAEGRLILHDALLDAGHAEPAEHFRAEEWHPKGCWALDLILGRS